MLANMTDPLTAAGSMLRIVTSGVQLATTLQTYMELARDAEHELHDIVFDVNATASALKQLHVILDADKDAKTAVFNVSGIREVETVAQKCHAVYQNIIKLIQKASNSGNDGITESAGRSGTANPNLDPTVLEPLTLMGKLAWPWLRPRILRCQKQLSWLKVSLLFTLQVASIAQSQLSGRRQTEETNLRQEMAVTLQKRRNLLLYGIAGNGAAKSSDVESPSIISSTAGSVAGNQQNKGKACAYGEQDQTRQSSLSSSSSSDSSSQIADFPDLATASVTSTSANSGEGAGLNTADQTKEVPKPGPHLLASVPPVEAAAIPTGTGAGSPGPQLAADLFENVMERPPETISRQLPSCFSRWADRIFGSQRRYLDDEQSTTLEAYICENIAGAAYSNDRIVKVQFGHKRLLAGLKAMLKNRNDDQWSYYLGLGPEKRKYLDLATELIQRGRNHELTCVALQEFVVCDGQLPFLLIFFSIGRKNEPIILHFEGQSYYLPFAACRSIKSIKHAILDVCFSSSARMSMLPFISEDRFQLADERNIVILPRFLHQFIKPGAHLRLLPHKGWRPRQGVPVALGLGKSKSRRKDFPIRRRSTAQSDTASQRGVAEAPAWMSSACSSLLSDGVPAPAAALHVAFDIYKRPVTVD
ncbi:hypothetical protein V2A60_008474 [Cordyceps javanica]